jgi:ankyrin repeat domain-containing protein 50
MVDALDECPANNRHQMIGFLTRLVKLVPRAKVFVTSRRESDIAEAFENKGVPIIQIEAKNVAADIEAYVRDETRRLRDGYDGKKLYLKDDLLEETIIVTLSRKSEGM